MAFSRQPFFMRLCSRADPRVKKKAYSGRLVSVYLPFSTQKFDFYIQFTRRCTFTINYACRLICVNQGLFLDSSVFRW